MGWGLQRSIVDRSDARRQEGFGDDFIPSRRSQSTCPVSSIVWLRQQTSTVLAGAFWKVSTQRLRKDGPISSSYVIHLKNSPRANSKARLKFLVAPIFFSFLQYRIR